MTALFPLAGLVAHPQSAGGVDNQSRHAVNTPIDAIGIGIETDPSDPEALTIWVDRLSSGEGNRGTEVNAQANVVTGLTLLVRQSVCTNKGDGQACED